MSLNVIELDALADRLLDRARDAMDDGDVECALGWLTCFWQVRGLEQTRSAEVIAAYQLELDGSP